MHGSARAVLSWEPANLHSMSVTDHPLARRLQSRLRDRAMIAVENRRVFPYLVGVIAVTSVVTGLVAHLIDRKDFPSFGVGVWWAIVTLGTVGYGDVVRIRPGDDCSAAS